MALSLRSELTVAQEGEMRKTNRAVWGLSAILAGGLLVGVAVLGMWRKPYARSGLLGRAALARPRASATLSPQALTPGA